MATLPATTPRVAVVGSAASLWERRVDDVALFAVFGLTLTTTMMVRGTRCPRRPESQVTVVRIAGATAVPATNRTRVALTR